MLTRCMTQCRRKKKKKEENKNKKRKRNTEYIQETLNKNFKVKRVYSCEK